MWKNPNLYLLKKKVSKKYMLNKLKQTKIKLMKDRRDTKERLNKLTGTIILYQNRKKNLIKNKGKHYAH